MLNELQRQQALEYHANGRPGKIEVIPTKEAKTQRDLSLAYSPGVAEPCKEISRDSANIYKYTAKGNLVGVISNGTAVLGLGNIGPEASKPVMEGKGVLFKIFADIDVFDIEIAETDPDKFVEIVKALEPTFGGINLEDIKAPECFHIEKRLREEMNIPVMHDDQHGTAIISSAALLNALEIQRKNISKVKFVVSGAGAAALACVQLYAALGANPKNFTLFDVNGVLHQGRNDLDPIRQRFSVDQNKAGISFAQAFKDADVFLGLSVGNIVTPDMIKAMAKNPIVFALANPDPEINYDLAHQARPDVIVATGRSDTPNQVNNVLGFPYIFRGALDVRSVQINEEMKMAAVKALAGLAKTPVPEIVTLAYNQKNISFGANYIIPKPLDPRLLAAVAPAVARAAMDSGVARDPIVDWEKYEVELNHRLGLDNQLFRIMGLKARKDPRHVAFAEGDNPKVVKAAHICMEEGICFPILLGEERKIIRIAEEAGLNLEGITIIDPKKDEFSDVRQEYGETFFAMRGRKGFNHYEAVKAMKDRNYFGCMMLHQGSVDAFISGPGRDYPELIRPALRTIGVEPGVNRIAGMYILQTKKGPLFLADATINLNPTAEQLAEISLLAAKEVKSFNLKPKIALLSYSNFGSSPTPEATMMAKVRELVKKRDPDLVIDGELQGILAFNKDILKENYPFSELVGQDVNTLIFPNLSSGNIAYNLLREVGGADAIGPVLLGMRKPVHALQLGSSIRSIINMTIIAVLDAQTKCPRKQEAETVITKRQWWKRRKAAKA